MAYLNNPRHAARNAPNAECRYPPSDGLPEQLEEKGERMKVQRMSLPTFRWPT